MADVEHLQTIVVELRKFRKKLRQIEKLEELERDLTEEEILKLSKKDDVRSKVQQLVARTDVLKSELQNMESETSQNEQATYEQGEQLLDETVQAPVESSVGEEVSNQTVPQAESELSINEAYDQAPVLQPHLVPRPIITVPDVIPTARTGSALLVTSDRTFMRFHVRNFQGHNDIICSVDCRGSVLVSGRGNFHVQNAVRRARICKRGCIHHQHQGQRYILESSARTYDHWQVEGTNGKRDGAVITEILDDGIAEGEKATNLTCQSNTTVFVIPQRLNVEDRKESFTNELQQTLTSFQSARCFSHIWLQTAHERIVVDPYPTVSWYQTQLQRATNRAIEKGEGTIVELPGSGKSPLQGGSDHTSRVQATLGNEAIGDAVTAVRMTRARSQGQDLSEKIHKRIKFYTRSFKGHTDHVDGVDCRDSVLVSGGRDTMLKLWDADTGREMRSMGGHTGTITSVLLVPNKDMLSSAVPSGFRTDQYSVLTGSRDCSMKIWSLSNGQIKRSMYAFSPVECLDCNSNHLTAAGLDGGKVELWDLETGTTLRSVRAHDEDTVTAVKFQGDRVISGSASGVVKVWDIRDNSLKPMMSSDQSFVDSAAGNVTMKPRRVRCLATTRDTVYWGDDGVNLKAMDLKSGKLRKIRNHVTEFGSTGALASTGSYLVSAGYDLDRGNGYLNVRSLPSEEYLETIDDENTGCITCLSCTETTRDKVTLHRMCTGGVELKVWDQLPSSKVKKRSRPETDDVYITAKHVRRYSLPNVSDTESSEDDDDHPEGDDSDDDDDVSNTGSVARSWCAIS